MRSQLLRRGKKCFGKSISKWKERLILFITMRHRGCSLPSGPHDEAGPDIEDPGFIRADNEDQLNVFYNGIFITRRLQVPR